MFAAHVSMPHPHATYICSPTPQSALHILDIVLHHPGLRFLADNPMFQERYSTYASSTATITFIVMDD